MRRIGSGAKVFDGMATGAVEGVVGVIVCPFPPVFAAEREEGALLRREEIC